MTTPAPGWSPRQWIGLTALLAALHAGGFWLIARFPSGPRLEPSESFGLVWSDTSIDTLDGLVPSPTRFALPETGGFSGDAARALPPVVYGWGRTEPRPSFLPADPGGANLGPAPATPHPPIRATQVAVSPPPAKPTAPMGLAEAQVEILGELSGRGLIRPLGLAPWTESDSPQPTRVELAVNPWGEVLTARVTVGSGSRTADLAVLEAVRNARFRPLEGLGRTDLLQAGPLTWGMVCVHPAPATSNPGPLTPP
jgi:TonB family protein